METVEEKNNPKEPHNNTTNATVKTNGIIMRLTNMLHTKVNVVVIYSGLCIIQGLMELRNVLLFSDLFIKKRQY